MDSVVPPRSVLKGFCRIITLTDEIRRALHQSLPIFNNFDSMQGHIKLLHRGILALLACLRVPPGQFIGLGLRIRERDWRDSPWTAYGAIYEVRRIMAVMESLIDLRNGRSIVRGYHSLFGIEFGMALISIRSLHVEDPSEVFDIFLAYNMPRPTSEEINQMTVYLATEEDASQDCPLCFERISVGQQIKILPCSHRYHKSCIDNWLANNGTCPLDQGRVLRWYHRSISS